MKKIELLSSEFHCSTHLETLPENEIRIEYNRICKSLIKIVERKIINIFLLQDFFGTVKGVTLIFISGHGTAISSV